MRHARWGSDGFKRHVVPVTRVQSRVEVHVGREGARRPPGQCGLSRRSGTGNAGFRRKRVCRVGRRRGRGGVDHEALAHGRSLSGQLERGGGRAVLWERVDGVSV